VKQYEQEDFRWAPRVQKIVIHRLYTTWAAGVVDEDLIDEVGIAFLARCETIWKVTERLCPTCGGEVEGASEGQDAGRRIACNACGWESQWRCYHRAYKGDTMPVQNRQLREALFAKMEKAGSPTEKSRR